jgi:hypothetical protein
LLVGGRVADSRKHVSQILRGFHVVGDAGADERVEPGEVPPGARMTEKEIVVPRQSNDSQAALGAVVVNRYPSDLPRG